MRTLAFLALLAAIPAGPAAAQYQPDAFEGRLLDLQNGARIREKLPPLVWSDTLAKAADSWARQLAREGRLHHSEWKDRAGTGENLWIGTRGMYGPDDMIGGFLSERRYFRAGTFPQVSTTGRWEDVGHYSQIIWPTTQAVGCALETGREYDVLVCRYWPAGNYFGDKVG